MNLWKMIEDGGDASDGSRVENPQGLIRHLEGDMGIHTRDYNWRKWEDGFNFRPDDLFRKVIGTHTPFDAYTPTQTV